MNSKRLFSMMIIIVVIVLMGCSNGKEVSTKDKTKASGKEKKNVSDDIDQDFNKDGTIKETVVVDREGIKIVIKDLVYMSHSAEIEVYIENKGKKDIKVSLGNPVYDSCAINNYMISELSMNTTVAKGKHVTETVSFAYNDVIRHGVNKIVDFYLGFLVQDTNYETILTGGKKIKTSLAKEFDYKKNTYIELIKSRKLEQISSCNIIKVDERDIYSKGGVNFISQVFIETAYDEGDREKILLLEVENTSEKEISVELNNLAINGVITNKDSNGIDRILPKCKKVIYIEVENFMNDNILPLLKLDEINKIEYEIYLYEGAEYEFYNNSKTLEFQISKSEKEVSLAGKKVFEDKNITIRYNGIAKAKDIYGDRLIFTVENNRNEEIVINTEDSLSVNDVMVGNSSDEGKFSPNTVGIYQVGVSLEDLKGQTIEIDNIKNLGIQFNIINDAYDTIVTPSIKFNINEDK